MFTNGAVKTDNDGITYMVSISVFVVSFTHIYTVIFIFQTLCSSPSQQWSAKWVWILARFTFARWIYLDRCVELYPGSFFSPTPLIRGSIFCWHFPLRECEMQRLSLVSYSCTSLPILDFRTAPERRKEHYRAISRHFYSITGRQILRWKRGSRRWKWKSNKHTWIP